jgi:D-aminopeptidase
LATGFGKLAGSTQVDEMGDIETPILLTSTTSVPREADAMINYMLALAGNEDVLSINPVVGETNDGFLNYIRGRHISPEDVFSAIQNAKGGQSKKEQLARARARLRLDGRVGSGRPHVASRRVSVDTRWECWCSPTLEVFSRSRELL